MGYIVDVVAAAAGLEGVHSAPVDDAVEPIVADVGKNRVLPGDVVGVMNCLSQEAGVTVVGLDTGEN